jgi:WD40 repeat protein/tRNA A-37 threonylcarbamoyl transferase component Bud32
MNSSHMLGSWFGRSIGENQRYRIEQHLGGGGMGDVFLAIDQLLGCPVALKLLKEKLAIGELRKRFEREVAVCVALRSQHIVQVTDYGVTDEGYPFYVMEYLQGQTLRQRLKQEKRLTVEQAVRIVAQICEGLSLAHQGVVLNSGFQDNERVKVIHRDLKPDNIFLVPTAIGELVKILDFGIAKLRGDQAEQTVATNMFLGTYRYSAPEQLKVEQGLDERADLYSLGIILYEMLSGTDPFGLALSHSSVSGVAWAVAHCSEPPTPLRQQPKCEQISAQLEAIVLRCLEKSPDDRFISVAELQTALQSALNSATLGSPNQFSSLNQAQNLDSIASVPVHSGHPTQTDPEIPPTAFEDVDVKNVEVKRADDISSVTTSVMEDVTPTVLRSANALDETRFTHLSTIQNPHLPLVRVGTGLATLIFLSFGVYYGFRSPLTLGTSAEGFEESAVLQSTSTAESTVPLLQEISSALHQSFTGHSDTVWSVALSPDGNTVIGGSYDRTINLWDKETGELIRTLSGHSDAVRSVAVRPDGKILASGSSDNTIRLWDIETGELIRTLSGHSGPVWSIAISNDGETLASGSYDGTVRIWNLQTGELIHTLPEHYDSVWSVAISPDGRTLVSGSYDGTAKVWNLQTGELIRSLSRHSEPVRAVAISPNGQILATASWDKTIKIWNLQTGELIHTLEGHTDRVISVAFSPSGEMLASGSLDRTINLWTLASGSHQQTLFGHSDWVVAVAFGRNEETLVSGSKDQTVNLWRWHRTKLKTEN